MKYFIEHKPALTLIGVAKNIQPKFAPGAIPAFHSSFYDKYMEPMITRGKPQTEVEYVITQGHISEYEFFSFENCTDGTCKYMICGVYLGGPVPEGMELIELPEMDWVRIPTPLDFGEALRVKGSDLARYWTKHVDGYTAALPCALKWNAEGNPDSQEYEGGIWIPVVQEADR